MLCKPEAPLMPETLAQFSEQLMATSVAEWCAVVLAIGYVVFAARQNSLCWLCAFLSTALYTWLFWQVTLPFQSALNAYYMVMAVYGFYKWGAGDEGTAVKTWPLYWHLALVPAALLAAYGLSQLLSGQFNTNHLWLDASIHLLSVVTTFMVAHKVLENWLYWFFINLASAYLYAQNGLVLSACLFVCYLGFSVYGYWQWRGQWKLQYASGINHQSAG